MDLVLNFAVCTVAERPLLTSAILWKGATSIAGNAPPATMLAASQLMVTPLLTGQITAAVEVELALLLAVRTAAERQLLISAIPVRE